MADNGMWCCFFRLKTLTDVTLSLAQCVSHPLKKNADAAIFTDPVVLAFLGQVYQPMSDTDIPQVTQQLAVLDVSPTAGQTSLLLPQCSPIIKQHFRAAVLDYFVEGLV